MKDVNRTFAQKLVPLLEPRDVIWVHDYHLIPLGRRLRELGVKRPIGFFLHIPFPNIEMLRVLPSYAELLRDLHQLRRGRLPDAQRSAFVSLRHRAPVRR